MSRSVSPSEPEGLSANEAMRRDHPEYFADEMPERPNSKIRVRIRLNQRRAPASPEEVLESHADMIEELRESHNMSTDLEQNGDIVFISGIPPDNNFNQQQALNVVRRYAPNATFA